MSNLFSGEFKATAVDPQIGESGGKFKTRIEFEIVEGERKGQRAAYDGKLDPDNIKFTKAAMMKVGWQGKDVRTFREDVLKAKKVVDITCEVASFTDKTTGKIREWTSVRKIGGAAPLAPINNDKVGDVNRWFAEAPDLDPSMRGGSGGGDDDIPFITCDMNGEPSPIARLLR